MSIKIVHEDGLSCPKFFCDYCGRPIEKAGAALYLWAGHPEGEPVGPFILHKGSCDRGLCERMGWERDETSWGELEVLPVFLGNNMSLDWRHARELSESA